MVKKCHTCKTAEYTVVYSVVHNRAKDLMIDIAHCENCGGRVKIGRPYKVLVETHRRYVK